MKNYILVLSILVILASCISGKSTKIPKTRIIRNNSSYLVNLTITASENYQFRLITGDSAVFEGYYEIGEGADFSEIGWSAFEPISGKIVFDNEREIIYDNGSCENGRNPLNPNIWMFDLCGYIERENNGKNEYVYEINDSDYEMAVPIED